MTQSDVALCPSLPLLLLQVSNQTLSNISQAELSDKFDGNNTLADVEDLVLDELAMLDELTSSAEVRRMWLLFVEKKERRIEELTKNLEEERKLRLKLVEEKKDLNKSLIQEKHKVVQLDSKKKMLNINIKLEWKKLFQLHADQGELLFNLMQEENKLVQTDAEKEELYKNLDYERKKLARLDAEYRLYQKTVKSCSEGCVASLFVAAVAGDTATVKLLVGAGADVNGTAMGLSALYVAAQNSHVDTCRVLLGAGADVRARNFLDWTALHGAVRNGHIQVCRLLLDSGAQVDARADNGTPLHWAARSGTADVVRLLLQRGADRSLKTRHGFTALDLARDNDHTDVVAILSTSEPRVATGP